MPDDTQICFACTPRTAVVALRDPLPGVLCRDHKHRCTLAAGLSLSEALSLAEPPSELLEGSSLAYVYNPVFVTGSTGQTLKGWADFAGGGLGVFEDRFSATNRFEHWALEREELRTLWQPLLEASARDGDRLDLPALATRLDGRGPRNGLLAWLGWFLWRRGQDPDQQGWHSVQFCIEAAMSNWQLQTCVEEHRARAPFQWPTSFSELQSWLTTGSQEFALPPNWTNDHRCLAFTRDMVAIGQKRLDAMRLAV